MPLVNTFLSHKTNCMPQRHLLMTWCFMSPWRLSHFIELELPVCQNTIWLVDVFFHIAKTKPVDGRIHIFEFLILIFPFLHQVLKIERRDCIILKTQQGTALNTGSMPFLEHPWGNNLSSTSSSTRYDGRQFSFYHENIYVTKRIFTA